MLREHAGYRDAVAKLRMLQSPFFFAVIKSPHLTIHHEPALPPLPPLWCAAQARASQLRFTIGQVGRLVALLLGHLSLHQYPRGQQPSLNLRSLSSLAQGQI